MNPTKEFRDYLISQGAALVGIGDLTAVPSSDYPVGIAVAIPLPKHVIKDLQLAPTREYYKLYTTLNDKLNAIVTAGEKYLTQAWQAPHWECVTGVSQVSGASVRREESLTAEPYCGVTSRLFLPIQPRPARVAIV